MINVVLAAGEFEPGLGRMDTYRIDRTMAVKQALASPGKKLVTGRHQKVADDDYMKQKILQFKFQSKHLLYSCSCGDKFRQTGRGSGKWHHVWHF
ncbi:MULTISPECIES: hypothetical protein [unclassified Bradyrhizobium]|uniref:hypothetical protein n=1 Tax=unclassified Bradyrhizobium TaxID=2631580 RepID=UPI001FFBC9CC|nr:MULTISPECIES: hypothetical protein [unclassified Bradyrhizobium]MCK1535441.1 hypothetical protein [Bradyrhizobium sp. 176]MCK1558118.1 hypothetical protein [Bradyrhizobium sp. 171]